MSSFEFWLTDDSGRRMLQLEPVFASYSRTTEGYGALQLGVPYYDYIKKMPITPFQRDWRIDAWIKPGPEYPLRRDGSFILRKYSVYQRVDGVMIIEFYGRSPIEILRRQSVLTTVAADYQKTDYIDDMMKDIVTRWFDGNGNTPLGEFVVDSNLSLGPSVTHEFGNKIVLDVLEELKDASLTLNLVNGTSKIYYDVVEDDSLVPYGFGYRFRTYAAQRGVNRTNELIFSPENGNIEKPYLYEDYLDEANDILVFLSGYDGTAEDAAAINASRWNRIARMSFGIEDALANDTTANALLKQSAGRNIFNADLLSTPGSKDQPRSLYRVDWDLGDIVSVQFAKRYFSVMLAIVYVSINEDGKEKITARTLVGE
jgi:hypothetical protein